MSRNRTAIAVLALLAWCAASATTPVSAAPIPGDWVAKWREDLEAVRESVPAQHPRPFASLPREEWNSELDRLSERIASLSHHEIELELARIIARIGDGHTRLTLPLDPATDFVQGHSTTPPPSDPTLAFRCYPIRFHLFADGLAVTRVERRLARAAGAKVISIGGTPVEDAIAAITPVVHGDNAMQVKDLLPQRLALAEVLAARGVAADPERLTLELEDATGRFPVELAPAGSGAEIDWVDARASASPSRRDENYWFEEIDDGRAIYCQYNLCEDDEAEPMPPFADRLAAAFESRGADRLIIDLRSNWGGSNAVNQPFIRRLICCEPIQRLGRLYVLIGRHTFSAATMFALDLERHFDPIFVGEPTGGKPNHPGDSRKITLPNSGLTVRASTLYWQYSDPRDEREWIAPHLPVDVTVADYVAGRDPVLETAIKVGHEATSAATPADPAGAWDGILQIRGFAQFAMGVTLTRSDGAWRATLDLPDWELQDAPLDDVVYSVPALSFTLRDGDDAYIFDGWIEGNRLLGYLQYGARRRPFMLSRRED